MKSGCEGQRVSKKRSVPLPVLPGSPPEKNDIRASRTSRWRAAALIALNLLMIAHIVQWAVMGKTISPIEPSEAMYTLQTGAVNAGAIFFALAITATLIFGRFICGWGCHVVSLQDLCAWMLKKVGLTPRPFRSRLLVWVPLIVALYMFIWPTFSRYITKTPNEPLIPQFTNHLVTTEFWATFPPVSVAIPFLFICGFMTVYFLGSKGFCTYGCPYGGFFGIADKVAPGRIRVTDACNQCGHCTATCTSNVIVHAEVKQYGMVVDPGCMKCMDCVSVCPNEALYFGFGKPAVGVKKTVPRNYSITWPEEIFAAVVFFAAFLAVWNVYQLVPMLMALGVAIVTTFVALRTVRLFRSGNLAFYRYSLKTSGTITLAGWLFLTFSAAWIGLNAHSGWVRFHERAGNIAFESIRLPDELALAQADPRQWLSPADSAAIASGKEHYRTAAKWGLFTNAFALPKFAWLEYLSGDTAKAVSALAAAAEYQEGREKALSLYYRGAILNRLGRHDEALTSLDQALAERSDLITALEEKGESLWQIGRKEDAVAVWNDAANRNPGLVLVNYYLAGAASTLGKPEAARIFEQKGERATPRDPYFYWMLGLRLKSVGMTALAERQFERAIQLDPRFRARRNVN